MNANTQTTKTKERKMKSAQIEELNHWLDIYRRRLVVSRQNINGLRSENKALKARLKSLLNK